MSLRCPRSTRGDAACNQLTSVRQMAAAGHPWDAVALRGDASTQRRAKAARRNSSRDSIFLDLPIILLHPATCAMKLPAQYPLDQIGLRSGLDYARN